jgi:hypothetical protein
MIKTVLSASVFSALATFALAGSALSQPAVPNIAGTYRCEASGDGCKWSGSTFTVNQTGNTLDAKNDKGEIGSGHVTSPITVSMGPPWNMFGVIHEANTIEWSNGTQWRKQ